MDFDFTKAEALLPVETPKLAFNLAIRPHWLPTVTADEAGNEIFTWKKAFWFRKDIRRDDGQKGKRFVAVNAETGITLAAFDHARVAQALSQRLRRSSTQVAQADAMEVERAVAKAPSDGPEVTADSLPFDTFDWTADGRAIEFTVNGSRYRCTLDTYRCTRLKAAAKVQEHEVPSPDGKWAAFLRGHNLWVRSLETGKAKPLTTDGLKDFDYASRPDFYGAKTVDLIHGRKQKPLVIWSPDSTRLLTHRLDQRRVRKLPVMQYVPEGEYAPAKMHQVRYPLAGDEALPTVAHVVLGLDGSRVEFQQPPLELRNTDPLFCPFWQNIWWDDDGTSIYYIHPTRGYRSTQFFEANAATGAVRIVYEETSDSFMDLDMRFKGGLLPDVRVMRKRGVFIWPSQKSGWQHLYLHDLATGEQLQPITEGDWVVRELVAVDEANGWIYFLGSGREPGRDVYLQHLYRVRLDGSDLTLLTPENANHEVHMAPDRSGFVDTYSRVNTAPVSVLRRADGELVCKLAEADIEGLLAAGYQLPEPFVVKADDGETDIYGILIRPADFDPTRRYPIIEYEYGGPQTAIVPHGFPVGPGGDRTSYSQALAQLGFAVVMMDGRGTPGRSKAFHDAKHHLGDAAGLVDHVAGLRQLAQQHPWLDMNRVGIFGFSGGGYGSARAILTYPDVYKAAVACCGDHDNRLYDSTWWERYMGLGDFANYPPQDNQSLAGNLKGRLLLMHGDVDDNVHPNLTMRLVNALIEADKEFDMLLLPNRGHALGRDKYVAHRTWAYFLRNL
ncbi:MAG: S9 family peptidase [Alicyclobacillus sp.]|nr:S9 family peptidase [Alicyclobacillus sp.]